MKQINPTFGQIIEKRTIAPALGLDENQIDDRYPVQEVSTGTPFIMCPLKRLDAVKRACTDREKYFQLIEEIEAKAILVFSPETYVKENQLNVRVFADYYGVAEDPATGSANGCLAGYLVKYGYFGEDRLDIRVEQGYEIGRPSLLYLRAEAREEEIDVLVGGKVMMVAQGEFV